MRKFFREFKEFALRGNVISLAVGVIIGAAFQGVVTSLTTNIISPLIGLLIGYNFDTLSVTFFGVTLMYGAFITSVLNFILMAFVVFIMVRMMNRLLSFGKKSAPAPEPRLCPFCKTAVHNEAIRCPACTSCLTDGEDGAEKEEVT
ncbi:MAG: large conductance mechanosensitive channel protein MscL [Oscillospiraceae bacterium]|nr:large conductance mechanosensitive channel protein MscL [Oscillospiraceae bacterium]